MRGETPERLGDILSQRQIVPPAFFGRQIVPDDKMSHFLPMRQIVPATKCPISSPATKCPTDDPTEKPLFHWHFSGDKLSQGDKMSHFLPGDKMSQLMHLCTWKLWKVVGTFCHQWKRLLGEIVASEKGQSWAYLGGYFSVRRHYNITVCYKKIRERQVGQLVAIEKEINIEHIWEILR